MASTKISNTKNATAETENDYEIESSIDSTQFSMRHLMIWPIGVGFALSINGPVHALRARAWESVYNFPSPNAELGLKGYSASIICGTCLSFAYFALREKHLWKSPGKICFVVIGVAGLIEWSASLFASSMVLANTNGIDSKWLQHFLKPLADSVMTNDSDILTIWFGYFAHVFGYGLFTLLAIVFFFKTACGFHWRLIWLGGFVFCFLMLSELVWDSWYQQPLWIPPSHPLFRFRYDIARLIPASIMLTAFTIDLVRKKPLDWPTLVASVLVPGACYLGFGLQIFSLI
ncbi:MAG: hypothetical protein AB8B55_04535 [Mariniblastus sp.]